MLNKIIATGALMLGTLFPLSANAATTVFTEDFNGVRPNGAQSTGQAVGKFIVDSGEVDVLGDLGGNYFGCPGGAGNNCIDMNGNRAGALLSLVELVAGNTYRVLFDLAGNGQRPSGVYQLAVSLDGDGPEIFDVPELAPFQTFSFDYVAPTTRSATLAFQSLNFDSPGFWGPILDNVRVDNVSVSAAVPEPATWAMMIAGFGLTGAVLRRRRSSIAVQAV